MQGDDLDIFLKSLKDTLCNRISEFEKKDSGWSLSKIVCIDMNINKFNPLRGTSYIELPHDVQTKKAVVNVKNADVQCFKWALLSALYPVAKNADKVTSYVRNENKLKFDGVSFPVKLCHIPKVEKLNNISVNVFGLEYDDVKKQNSVVGPLYFTNCRKSCHINLLYITNGSNGHYCHIKNMSRLIRSQLTSRPAAIHLCDGCLLYFSNKEQLLRHQEQDCNQIRTDLPSEKTCSKNWFGENVPNNKVSFDKYQKQLKVPFVIYADFESFLRPIASCSNDPDLPHTEIVQRHDVYSFGYYIKCAYDDSLSKYRTYVGDDCAKKFMESLQKDIEIINKINNFQKGPLLLSDMDKDKIDAATICYICERDLKSQQIIDYDWYTGVFRGVAHEICSSKFRSQCFIPVILHNLSNYDAHFIVHALNFAEGAVEIIPQNKERYISFSKLLKVNNHRVSLRFIDSLKFLSCCLETLANNLNINQFDELRKHFPNEQDFNRLIRKGVYPYEFMTGLESLKQKSLPTQNQFFSSITDANVSNEDYEHAKDVWQHFKCCSMSDYSDLYLKTDVLLLSDIFENFRTVCMSTYGLDPAHYYTAGLSWDAMLKYTKIELELLTDFDKIAFIKSGIRGGVSQCSHRYAKANNHYMNDYDKSQANSYLIYLDANNLYGWAMSQYLPVGGFQWVDIETNFKVAIDSEIGYILEVDLEYPDNLHDLHSDFPLCPENVCIGNTKDFKLVPNLNNKSNYVIHYRNLIQCLNKGLKIKKIHRILKFDQSPWLSKYIELNTNQRTKAKSDFEKDFYKLMNNAIFGKTMENIEKRVNVKLLTHWENRGKIQGAQSLIARPEFHSLSIFSKELVAIQLRKTKLIYN